MDVASASCHVDWCLNVYNLCHAICSLLALIRQNDFFLSNQVFAGTFQEKTENQNVLGLFLHCSAPCISFSSTWQVNANCQWTENSCLRVFLCSLCPGKNSSETNKLLKDQTYVDPLASTDYSLITAINH